MASQQTDPHNAPSRDSSSRADSRRDAPSRVEQAIRAAVTKGVMAIGEINRNLAPARAGNPFLEGVHKPMESEITLHDLPVEGEIPAELDGRYIRIGPNPVTPPKPGLYHWFTGEGMVHGVRLRQGRALWYRNRWIRSRAVSAALGEPEAPGPRGMFDAVNTNIAPHAGAAWALVEAGGNPVRIDEELNTVAHDPFGGTLHGAFSAHPHLDPETGEWHAICYDGREQNFICHVVVDRQGKVRREAKIPVRHGPSIHDCMITKNYVVILDLPVTFSMRAALQGKNFPYEWNPAHEARVGLLPREGAAEDIVWSAVEPCYVFHPCNGYEDANGDVVLDVCVHDRMFDKGAGGPDSNEVPFERWVVPKAGGKVARRVIDAAPQEFPRPNEALIGKPYRYAYCVALSREGGLEKPLETRLFKHDLETGAREVHDFGAGHCPGEFVFVPRPGATGEDEGWLMGYVLNVAEDTTDLAILDAARFTAPPAARVRLPHRIPPGFHGNWLPTAG